MNKITRIKSDKIILADGLFCGYVYFQNGQITDVTDKDLPFDIEFDKTGLYVSPGFIDIHTHGGDGCEFYDDYKSIITACNFHLRYGTTSICPTISAAPFKVMSKSVAEVKKAMQSAELKSNIIGLHLEGPYLSAEQCGGQCPDHITPPKPEEYEALIETAGDVIARWSYAPENDKDGTFCKYLTEHNILASAGHTNAIYPDIQLAFNNGCNLITHLYSCTSTITREFGFRRLGVIESAYLNDDMYVEIIADGKHLPPELIKLILKIKGTDKVILITDSLALAGTNVKSGMTLGTEFIIEDGVCKLKDRSAFAGSIATANRLIQTLTNEVGTSLVEAVKMLTKNPSDILGLNKGELKCGKDADIIIFDDNIEIKNAFVDGKIIF